MRCRRISQLIQMRSIGISDTTSVDSPLPSRGNGALSAQLRTPLWRSLVRDFICLALPLANSSQTSLHFLLLLKQGTSPDAPNSVDAAPVTDSAKPMRRLRIRVIDLAVLSIEHFDTTNRNIPPFPK
jgi:hypothetical protein